MISLTNIHQAPRGDGPSRGASPGRIVRPSNHQMLHNLESQRLRKFTGAFAKASTFKSSHCAQPCASGSIFANLAKATVQQGCRTREPAENRQEHL